MDESNTASEHCGPVSAMRWRGGRCRMEQPRKGRQSGEATVDESTAALSLRWDEGWQVHDDDEGDWNQATKTRIRQWNCVQTRYLIIFIDEIEFNSLVGMGAGVRRAVVSKQNLFTEARVSPGTQNGIVHLTVGATFWSYREKYHRFAWRFWWWIIHIFLVQRRRLVSRTYTPSVSYNPTAATTSILIDMV